MIKFNLPLLLSLLRPIAFLDNHTHLVWRSCCLYSIFLPSSRFYTFIRFCFVHHPLTQRLPRHTIIIVFVCMVTRGNTDVDNFISSRILWLRRSQFAFAHKMSASFLFVNKWSSAQNKYICDVSVQGNKNILSDQTRR